MNYIASEIQQSREYYRYLQALGWTITMIGDDALFSRQIPFYGILVKIQRPKTLPYIPMLIPILKKLHAKAVSVEPAAHTSQEEFTTWFNTLKKFFPVITSPFIPTKTILIATDKPIEHIFKNLTSAKQRAIRKAKKNDVIINMNQDIDALIRIKNQSAGLFGGITTSGVKKMYGQFAPRHTKIFLAKKDEKIIAGVLMILWQNRAHYWIAGATHEGKKLSAPSLLVWQAIEYAQKNKMDYFDFLGVWDERLPKENMEWKGFTKFKEGFGGEPLYYPISKRIDN